MRMLITVHLTITKANYCVHSGYANYHSINIHGLMVFNKSGESSVSAASANYYWQHND